MKRLVLVLGALAACSSSGTLSASSAATACVVAEACFPNEWAQGFFGASLAQCATGGGLLPPQPGSLIGSQIAETGLERPLADIYQCLATAGGDCAKADACWGRAGKTGSCAPAGSFTGGSCSGQTLNGCSADGVAFDVDCSGYGETCHEDSFLVFATAGVCDLGDCPSHPACQGSKAEICEGQGFWLADCGRLGLSCVLPPDGGGAECWTAQTCDPKTQPTCQGTTVVACQNGVPTSENCAQNATYQRCQAGQCVETGNECTIASDQASCDGTKVKFCQDGTYVEVDCGALGFKGCNGGACST